MLHACLYTICFVFCYTSWRFYAFSGANLLTRCHSVSSLFSTVFVLQKCYTGNILGIGRNKSEPPIFSEASRSPKIRQRGGRGQPHPRVAWPRPWPRHQGVRPPSPPPDAALPPIYSPQQEKPKDPDTFSSKHTASRRRCRREIGRVQKLFLAPYRRPSPPPWLPLEWCVSSLPWTTCP
jgi:hypothetical protein